MVRDHLRRGISRPSVHHKRAPIVRTRLHPSRGAGWDAAAVDSVIGISGSHVAQQPENVIAAFGAAARDSSRRRTLGAGRIRSLPTHRHRRGNRAGPSEDLKPGTRTLHT